MEKDIMSEEEGDEESDENDDLALQDSSEEDI